MTILRLGGASGSAGGRAPGRPTYFTNIFNLDFYDNYEKAKSDEIEKMEAAHKLRCDRSVNLQCSDSITNASHVHTARALWPSHSPCGPDS